MRRTVEDIQIDLWQTFAAFNNKVTYAGQSGVLADIFKTFANTIFEKEYEITKNRRLKLIETASGSELDELALSNYGLTRKAATKSTTYLIVTGPVGKIIGIGAKFYHKTSNEEYISLSGVTIGTANPDLEGLSNSLSFADVVLVESVNTGAKTKAGADSITVYQDSSVSAFNPSPTIGGSDVETDVEFRARIKSRFGLLEIYTNDFFNALALEANTDVAKAFTEYNSGTITIHVMKNSGGTFSGGDLSAIKTFIDQKIPAFFNVTKNILSLTTSVVNATFEDIDVAIEGSFYGSPTLLDTYIAIADKIGDNYINPGILSFGEAVTDDMVFRAVIDTKTSIDINLDTITVNNTTKVIPAANKICRFANLSLTDNSSGSPVTINFALNQRPI